MENLITIQDFEFQPYLVYAGDDSGEFLNNIITEYQSKILIDILGHVEFNNLVTDLNDTDTPTLTQWDYFVNGTTYTHDSISYVYAGIKPVLVKFVYYWWQYHTVTDLGSTGEIKKKLLNSEQVIPMRKMVSAYNSACHDIDNNELYAPTVYNFLSHMQDDNSYFPDWDYTEIKKLNMFNL